MGYMITICWNLESKTFLYIRILESVTDIHKIVERQKLDCSEGKFLTVFKSVTIHFVFNSLLIFSNAIIGNRAGTLCSSVHGSFFLSSTYYHYQLYYCY